MVRIIISKFGNVNEKQVEWVIGVVKECYNKLSPHNVDVVDVYIFDSKWRFEAFMKNEALKFGVSSSGFGDSFFASHDAWTGLPRISVCLELLNKLCLDARLGGLRHEIAHSILHGSLNYYRLPMTMALMELGKKFNLNLQYLTDLLYLLSVSVKDYEVTRFLYSKGYVVDQISYATHLLCSSKEEQLVWKLIRGDPNAEILYLASLLKVLGCVKPLTKDAEFGDIITDLMRNYISHLPEFYLNALLKVVSCLDSLGTDTIENLESLSSFFYEFVAKPIFKLYL